MVVEVSGAGLTPGVTDRREVVVGMNAGMSEGETLVDVPYPDELFDRPWMRACVRPGPASRQRLE